MRPTLTIAAVLAVGVVVGCGREPRAEPLTIRGRVVAPEGASLNRRVQVFASWQDATLPTLADADLVDGAGTFEIEPGRNGPVDLQVGVLSDVPGSPAIMVSDTTPIEEQLEDLNRDLPRPVRVIYAVDSLGGFVRGVEPGAQDVVIPLRPLRIHDVIVTVRDPSGSPVAGSEVRLDSLSDYVKVTTDTEGRAAVPDIPIRRWSATASVPSGRRDGLLSGHATMEPDAAELTVTLVRGVRMHVRLGFDLPSEDVFLAFGEVGFTRIWTRGWLPDEDGAMRILVRPEWAEITIKVQRVTDRSASSVSCGTLATVTAPVREGAVVVMGRSN